MIDELKGGGEPVFDSKGNVKAFTMKAALWAARFTLASQNMAQQVPQLTLRARMFLPQRDNPKVFLLALKGAVAVMEAVSLVAHRKQKLI